MNADQGDITLDSPEAFLLKTSGFAAAAISTPQIKVSSDRREDSPWRGGGQPDVIW
jgi:hypothetical protein